MHRLFKKKKNSFKLHLRPACSEIWTYNLQHYRNYVPSVRPITSPVNHWSYVPGAMFTQKISTLHDGRLHTAAHWQTAAEWLGALEERSSDRYRVSGELNTRIQTQFYFDPETFTLQQHTLLLVTSTPIYDDGPWQIDCQETLVKETKPVFMTISQLFISQIKGAPQFNLIIICDTTAKSVLWTPGSQTWGLNHCHYWLYLRDSPCKFLYTLINDFINYFGQFIVLFTSCFILISVPVWSH